MNMKTPIDDLFEKRISYPDFDYMDRFGRLVGIDSQKSRLAKMLGVLIDSNSLMGWAERYHQASGELVESVIRRPPLIVLAGDVGSGKTELAETIGDSVARKHNIDITLFPLSLSSRGQGRVGEMTQLVSSAFDYVVAEAEKLKSSGGKARGGVILLVDEADALAQSRESSQMHHEDRAGVNAFIRGIDRIANAKLPAAVIMCTNRANSLDPAVKRRAADVLEFGRPRSEQREALLRPAFGELGFTHADIDKLVQLTGKAGDHDYGYTCSDITQRLIPTVILDAYPDSKVTPSRAFEVVKSIIPTPPFQDIAQ